MAYVRKRGGQLAIVQGERDGETGKVVQRILFTFYSRAEAREAIGRGSRTGAEQFRAHLENHYPAIRFDWKKIQREIQANLSVLPDEYSYPEERQGARFREHLAAFARQLVLADTHTHAAAAEVLTQHGPELEVLADLIRWRLDGRPSAPSSDKATDRFFWRFALQSDEPPPDVEELLESFYSRGDVRLAQAGFQLLVDCFSDYAEGHNYLGRLAAERGDLDAAIEHFARAVELGRKRFPKRIAKGRFWTDLNTRPYVRGLRNLTLMLTRVGRHDEALEHCTRLEKECGDTLTAASFRASIYLNSGRWQKAAELARMTCKAWPSESFIAALALRELGAKEDALTHFLHGALNLPLVARWLMGQPPRKAEQNARDYEEGVGLLQLLDLYLQDRGPQMRRYFKRVLRHPSVDAMLDEVRHTKRRQDHQRPKGLREAFDRVTQMTSLAYARARARELAPRLLARG